MSCRYPKKTMTVVWSLAILLMYIVSLSMVEANRSKLTRTTEDVGIWNLPPIVLSVLAGEFKGLLADLLILEAGARVGDKIEKTSNGKIIALPKEFNNQTIFQILSASQSLDPAFQQTYFLAQGWLPWTGSFIKETNQMLQTAQENRPWDFSPIQFMSFNNYFFLNDYVQAGKILLNGATRENAPPYLGILGARLTQKGGDTKAAIALMHLVMQKKDPDEPGYDDLRDRLAALQGVLVIEQGVVQYQKTFSVLPDTPDQLVEDGILSRLPDNPYDLSYCINQKGKVFFDRPNCHEQ